MKLISIIGWICLLLSDAVAQSGSPVLPAKDRLSMYVHYTPTLTFRSLKDVGQTPLSSSVYASRNKLDIVGLGYSVGAGLGWHFNKRWMTEMGFSYMKYGHRQRLYHSTPVEISFGAPETSRFIQRYYYFSLPVLFRHLIPRKDYTLTIGGGFSFDLFHRESRYGRLKYANGKKTLMHFDSNETTQHFNMAVVISGGAMIPVVEGLDVGILPSYSFQLLSIHQDNVREWLRGGGVQGSIRVRL